MRLAGYTLTLALLLLLTGLAQGQDFIASYSYDACGNRVLAHVVYLSPRSGSAAATDTLRVDGTALSIAVYPNPTTGVVRVVLLSPEPNCGQVRLLLRDIQGRQLHTASAHPEGSDLDLSAQPDGAYILSVDACGSSSIFKIIKAP